ncbi:hypothetical protein [Sphingomonas sp. ACRSK]|uniref:hypothetical protein n=1 Tax=Sphingomonas sp. ACRSK TaxID=2918213 RepID=UPI001EF5BA75|nr:hypothetical protein [Sphingomonas sp. ACRSK]MCG7348820.1 hypothetical protein [Sphingomonas sp. ACRSK]
MSSYNEGNTKYRLQNQPMSRQYRVTAETFMAGKKDPLVHFVTIGHHEVDSEREAMVEGVNRIRPKVARAESLAKGVDPALPADPVIDKALERERAQRRHREEAEAEALAIKEAAGAYLNEQHPMWGMF